MIEVMDMKETRGLKSNMHSEIENLERKAYNKGYADGKKDAKTLTEAEESCSWSKGVMDAWEYLAKTYDEVRSESKEYYEEVQTMHMVFEDLDPMSYVRAFVEEHNKELAKKEEQVEKYEPKRGDVVADPSGHECIVLNTDTHIHVVYTNSGKTHKWKKSTEFNKVGECKIPKIIGVGKILI